MHSAFFRCDVVLSRYDLYVSYIDTALHVQCYIDVICIVLFRCDYTAFFRRDVVLSRCDLYVSYIDTALSLYGVI